MRQSSSLPQQMAMVTPLPKLEASGGALTGRALRALSGPFYSNTGANTLGDATRRRLEQARPALRCPRPDLGAKGGKERLAHETGFLNLEIQRPSLDGAPPAPSRPLYDRPGGAPLS